jgi:multidrug resistance efflux pump
VSAFFERVRFALRRLATRRGRVALLGVFLLAGGGLAATRGAQSDVPEPIPVRRADLVLTVEMEGELIAVRSAEIGAPPNVEAELKIAFLAPEGAEVRKGDPVLGFDSEALQRLLDQKRAELAEALQKIAQKEVDLRLKLLDLDQRVAQTEADLGKSRLKADVPADVRARIEVEKAELERQGQERDLENLTAERQAVGELGGAELRSLATQRDRARGRVADFEAAIEQMTRRAPQDGIVIYTTDWNNQKKKIGDNVWIGETVLSLPDLSEMRADASVDEADGGQVAVGQPVRLRLEARSDLDIGGKVTGIGQTVRRKSWRVPAKVYKVKIALDRTDPAVMRPAMRFRGEIETGRLPGRLVVPREAAFLREAGCVVFVRSTFGWKEKPVRLGSSNRSLVEVVEGLVAGDRILPLDLSLPAPASNGGPAGVGG